MMAGAVIFLVSQVLLLSGSPATTATTPDDAVMKPAVQRIIGKPDHVRFDIRALEASNRLNELLKPLMDSLKFAEGPAWSPEGYLIFSDIPPSLLYRWEPVDGMSIFRDPSNKTNGNFFLPDGSLISCEHGARRLSLTARDGTYRVLVDNWQGKKFNSPNDLYADSQGGIWFTDPDYGLGDREREIKSNNVYRYDLRSGAIEVVASDFNQPNGMCMSLNESRLYVADSGRPSHVRVFNVVDGRKLTNDRVFVKVDSGSPDGMCIDQDDNLYVSAGDGVRVYTAGAELITIIPTPRQATNACFGGEFGQSLFITAGNAIYRLRMPRAIRQQLEDSR